MLYVDGYAVETVVNSTFNDCELAKAIHLSGNAYNDSMVTIKMREDVRSRYAKYVYFNYSHARKCKQRDRELSRLLVSMNAEIPRKEEQKASQHLSYFMDTEFESTGQLLYRVPGYCLITLEVIFPFLN